MVESGEATPTRRRRSAPAFPRVDRDVAPPTPPERGPERPSLPAILARSEILGDAWTADGPLEDDWTPEDDHRYRTLYERKDRYIGVLSYEQARVAYRIGRLAARNPGLAGKRFDEVEDRLAAGWDADRWPSVRAYVRLGFERCRFDDELQDSRRAIERLERSWRGGGRRPA